jgi:hypothetical protein
VHTVVDDVHASSGTELVPLLEAQSAAVDAAARAAFPETTSFAPSATDGEGWHAGRLFADVADLVVSPRLDRTA